MGTTNPFTVHTAEEQKIVVLEHPGLVKDLDHAITSIGGTNAVSSFLYSEDPNKRLNLSLNPSDPFRRPVPSRLKSISDVVLKISVPKCTGRKRKRGSNDPFHLETVTNPHESSHSKASRRLLQSMRDNPLKCSVQAIGVADESYRFRSLPDFQFSLAGSPFADSFKSHILPFQYEKLKEFKFDTQERGTRENMDMIPPPSFSQLNIPFNYAYLQNPAVASTVDDTGKETTKNMSLPASTKNTTATLDDTEVPQAPPPDLASIETLDEPLQQAIRQLGEVLEERPIATRRYVANMFGHKLLMELRHAVKYHAYIFRSGPWRDCFVKYGLDPRHDPKYRMYQTLMFQIPIRDSSGTWEDGRVRWIRSMPVTQKSNLESHLFDGKTVIPDSKVWQACDITDPFLRRILDEDGPSESFNAFQDGWWKNGTWAKVRVIMRDKITLLLAGVEPSDAEYQKYLAVPSIIRKTPDPETESRSRDGPLAADIRSVARQSRGKLQARKAQNTPGKIKGPATSQEDLDEGNEVFDND